MKKNQLEISEEAYAASLQIDKVKYLQYIKVISTTGCNSLSKQKNRQIYVQCDLYSTFQTLPANSYEQMAEISVMNGRINEAETILTHNNKYGEAIDLCVRMHRWERALDIAKMWKNPSSVVSILQQRRDYLHALNKDEYLETFKKLESTTSD